MQIPIQLTEMGNCDVEKSVIHPYNHFNITCCKFSCSRGI